MQIAVSLAGFSMGEADVLRKAMGKKDPVLMDQQKIRFLEGARSRGIPDSKAASIFDLMAQFGEYGFNKSHSAAYALVAYQTAYLKAHYPVEYFCALMTSESGDTAKILRYIGYCREAGIPVLPPDVNESRYAFYPSGNGIRFGLSAIKGIGAAAVEAIREAMGEMPFSSVEDFLSRVDLRKVNKRAVESLVKAGAFDSLSPRRDQLFAALPSLVEEAQEAIRRKESGQFSLFGGEDGSSPAESASFQKPYPVWGRRELLANEKEALGFYITGHPLDEYGAELELFANCSTGRLSEIKPGGEVRLGGIVNALRARTTRRGDKMATLTLEDLEGVVDVLVFPETFRENQDLLLSDAPLFFVGQLEADDRSAKIKATAVYRMENLRDQLARSVHFEIRADRMTGADLADLRKMMERHRGEKKSFLHLVREGGFEAVFALPDSLGIHPSLTLARELRTRFGYGVLRLH